MEPNIVELAGDRQTTNYGTRTGMVPAAIPPGVWAFLLQILSQLLGGLTGGTGGGLGGLCPAPTPAVFIQHCKDRSRLAHFAVRRAVRQVGYEPGVNVQAAIEATIDTGAISTPEEVLAFATAVGE